MAYIGPAFAADADLLAGWELADQPQYIEGRRALKRFNETPKYEIERSRDRTSEFYARCDPLSRHCVHWVMDNRLEALRTLPTNPNYWAAFWDLLQTTPSTAAIDRNPSDPAFDFPEVFQAASHWLVYQLADRGRVDPSRALEFAQESRRLTGAGLTILDRMLGTAVAGMALTTTSFAMAQAAAEGDHEMLRALAATAHPPTREERSYRDVFAAERAYVKANVANMPTTRSEWEAWIEKHDLPLTQTYEEYLEENAWDAARTEELFKHLQAFVELSERPSDEFWGRGVDIAQQGLIDQPTDPEHAVESGYGSYVAMDRSMDLRYALLRAVGRLHAGAITLGQTDIEPYPHWVWTWEDDNTRLCLVPTSIHPSFTHYTHPVCVALWTADEVRDVLASARPTPAHAPRSTP